LEGFDRNLAVIDIALVIAEREPRADFSQKVLTDRHTAPLMRAVSLRSGSPAIHQDEFHVPSPNEVYQSETVIVVETGHHMSANHLSDAPTISRLAEHLLYGFDPAGRLLLFSERARFPWPLGLGRLWLRFSDLAIRHIRIDSRHPFLPLSEALERKYS
jgi:hypothetical protein